jgi:hypothetical protein
LTLFDADFIPPVSISGENMTELTDTLAHSVV